MVLQRLAVICAEAATPLSAGTAQGGAETVRWLAAQLAASAQQWQAAADGDSGGSERVESSETLAAALEVRQLPAMRWSGTVMHCARACGVRVGGGRQYRVKDARLGVMEAITAARTLLTRAQCMC